MGGVEPRRRGGCPAVWGSPPPPVLHTGARPFPAAPYKPLGPAAGNELGPCRPPRPPGPPSTSKRSSPPPPGPAPPPPARSPRAGRGRGRCRGLGVGVGAGAGEAAAQVRGDPRGFGGGGSLLPSPFSGGWLVPKLPFFQNFIACSPSADPRVKRAGLEEGKWGEEKFPNNYLSPLLTQ